MRNNFKQYEALLTDAVETADTCLDMEGGALFVAWNGELIQDLAAAGCFRSACFAVKKLCEVAGVEPEWTEFDGLEREEKQAWLELFAEVLMDQVSISAGKA